MTNTEIADHLEAAAKAFSDLPPEKQTRDSMAFRGINDNIRRAFTALDDEDPNAMESLERRGLATGHWDEPIPETFLPGVAQLAADLREAD